MEFTKKFIIMKNETYCPCCASDYTAFQQTNHFDNKLVEVFECQYCGSTFENVYRMETQKVTKDNSGQQSQKR